MDVLSLLLDLAVRFVFVLMPLTVAGLALRRVLRSRSANAWIYGGICLFSGVSAMGLLPWAIGAASADWLLFAFSILSPVLWINALMICDPVHDLKRYDAPEPEPASVAPRFKSMSVQTSAILQPATEPAETPVPVFRHHVPANRPRVPPSRSDAATDRSLLRVAKGMRGNQTSDKRRPLLLPPPVRYGVDLPFLPRR